MFNLFNKKKSKIVEPRPTSKVMNPILEILDSCAEAHTFPMLDNGYVYLAATRLTAYYGDSDWALVIEVFGFSPRAGAPDLAIHTFGNILRNKNARENYVSDEAYENYLKNNPYNCYKTFFPIGGDDIWINPNDNEIIIPNATFQLRGDNHLVPNTSVYSEHNIELEETKPFVYELCRYLAAIKRDAILATPIERRHNVPTHLSEVICLEDWLHPDLAEGEKPSEVESFQQISKVLQTGDASYYKPTVQGNTHWKNWPDSGTL